MEAEIGMGTASHRKARIAGGHQKLEEGMRHLIPQSLPKEPTLPTPDLGLQASKTGRA